MNRSHSHGPARVSRRRFLQASAVLWGASSIPAPLSAETEGSGDAIIDVHQHVRYRGRSNDVLIAHQRALGIKTSVLMPSGDRGKDHPGGSGEHEAVAALCRAHPGEFVFFANEISDLPDAPRIIARQLQRGAIGIGEQKFGVDCDAPSMARIADVARDFLVPILLHFSDGVYNRHIERFYRMLEKYPTVAFIGHAQAWWAAMDKNYKPGIKYPLGPVTPGGITDRYLSDYPNCYADLSAGTGIHAILRDEEHFRGFIARHRRKLLFGSDCSEGTGRAPVCLGARIIDAVRRLSPDRSAVRDILYENARRLLKIGRV